jgi:hypothetical protein
MEIAIPYAAGPSHGLTAIVFENVTGAIRRFKGRRQPNNNVQSADGSSSGPEAEKQCVVADLVGDKNRYRRGFAEPRTTRVVCISWLTAPSLAG